MKILFTLCLILSGVGFGKLPVAEFDDATKIAVSRGAAGLDYTQTSVAAYTGRSKNVLTLSAPVLVRSTTRPPFCVDEARQVCIFGDGTNVGTSSFTGWSTSPDGVTYTVLADRTATPFSTQSASGSFYSIVVLSDGSYITDYRGGGATKLYRYSPTALTWSVVATLQSTATSRCYSWTYKTSDGGYVLYPEYGGNATGDKVWMSSDYGVTWTDIYTIPVAAAGGANNHIHTAIFDPTSNHTTVYISNGDNANACMRAIHYNGASWSVVWEIPTVTGTDNRPASGSGQIQQQPTTAISDSTYIYWIPDGPSPILRQDMTTYRLTPIYRNASPKISRLSASPGTYYDDKGYGGYDFSVKKCGNVYLTAYMVTDSSSYFVDRASKIVATTDFITFADWLVDWTPTTIADGWKTIAGTTNGLLFIGLGLVHDTDKYGRIYQMPSCKVKSAVLTAPSYTNLASANGKNADSFEAAGFSTTRGANISAVSASTDYAYVGTKSLKMSIVSGSSYGSYTGQLIKADLLHTPVANEFITVSCRIKTDWQYQDYSPSVDGTKKNLGWFSIDWSGSSAVEGTDFYSWYYSANGGSALSYDGWVQLSSTVKIIAADWSAKDLYYKLTFSGYGDPALTHYAYLDGVEVTASSTYTPYIDKPYEAGTSTAIDSGLIPLSVKGTVGTVVVHYNPNYEYACQQSGNHNILKITGSNGVYESLYWNATDQKYYITNGTNSAASTNTAQPTRMGNVWIAIAYNLETPTQTIYIYDPENQNTITSTNVLTFKPLAMILGGDTGDLGLFDSVRVYNTALTSDEVLLEFSNVNKRGTSGTTASTIPFTGN